jgi:hypothetical protein
MIRGFLPAFARAFENTDIAAFLTPRGVQRAYFFVFAFRQMLLVQVG